MCGKEIKCKGDVVHVSAVWGKDNPIDKRELCKDCFDRARTFMEGDDGK
jgi:hypothetical protein